MPYVIRVLSLEPWNAKSEKYYVIEMSQLKLTVATHCEGIFDAEY